MEDEKGGFLNAHLEFFERNVSMLQNEVTKWMHAHEKTEQYLKGFRTTLESIAAQEPFEPLGVSLREMAKSADALNEATHDVVCERPEKQLLSMLAQIQHQAIVPIKVRELNPRSVRHRLIDRSLEIAARSRKCH